MQDSIDIRFRVPSLWRRVREIREGVAREMAPWGREIRDATVMVASELAENAVKYGESCEEVPDAEVEVRATDTDIIVRVVSGLSDEERARGIVDRIGAIDAAEDVEKLYLARMQDFIRDPSQHGGIGLLRIAYEGRFSLRAEWARGILTITAMRRLP